MKSVLVLYPIEPYAKYALGKSESAEARAKCAKLYQRLISKRYPDFQMVYVFFSSKKDMDKPNKSLLWKGFVIKPEDIVGACGVTFKEHCRQELYPNPKDIIALCPRPIEKLIVCGFHMWDCVEKTARFAYKQGIDVKVDDDLTDFFFFYLGNRWSKRFPNSTIPFSLEESLEKKRKIFEITGGIRGLERIRVVREKRPWLDQL